MKYTHVYIYIYISESALLAVLFSATLGFIVWQLFFYSIAWMVFTFFECCEHVLPAHIVILTSITKGQLTKQTACLFVPNE